MLSAYYIVSMGPNTVCIASYENILNSKLSKISMLTHSLEHIKFIFLQAGNPETNTAIIQNPLCIAWQEVTEIFSSLRDIGMVSLEASSNLLYPQLSIHYSRNNQTLSINYDFLISLTLRGKWNLQYPTKLSALLCCQKGHSIEN